MEPDTSMHADANGQLRINPTDTFKDLPSCLVAAPVTLVISLSQSIYINSCLRGPCWVLAVPPRLLGYSLRGPSPCAGRGACFLYPPSVVPFLVTQFGSTGGLNSQGNRMLRGQVAFLWATGRSTLPGQWSFSRKPRKVDTGS